MNKTIWKYELTQKDVTELELPIGAEILTFQLQNDFPCIWVLVDPEAEKEVRKFELIGTGMYVNHENFNYIGTFQRYNGNLVTHVFEIFQ